MIDCLKPGTLNVVVAGRPDNHGSFIRTNFMAEIGATQSVRVVPSLEGDVMACCPHEDCGEMVRTNLYDVPLRLAEMVETTCPHLRGFYSPDIDNPKTPVEVMFA